MVVADHAGGTLRHALAVLRTLAVADLRIRYGRGAGRTVRWLLEPYAAAGVYLLLIAFVLDRPGKAAGLVIACAIVPFQLVMMGISNALTAVQARRSIIAHMRFQRTLIPIASAVTQLAGFTAAFSLIGVMLIAYGVGLTAAVLWLPVLVAVTFLFAVAAAYPAALIGLWYPHLNPFMIGAVRAAYFLAPGIVALDQIHGRTRGWIELNPLTGLFEAFRSVFVDGTAPAARELLYPFAVAIVLLALFVPLFRRDEAQFVKLLE